MEDEDWRDAVERKKKSGNKKGNGIGKDSGKEGKEIKRRENGRDTGMEDVARGRERR